MKTLLLFVLLNFPSGDIALSEYTHSPNLSFLSLEQEIALSDTANSKLSDTPIYKDSTRVELENVSKKAIIKSALIPGWGQLYNARQWRQRKQEMKENGIVTPKLWWVSVPAIYGGFIGSIAAYNFNNRNYKWVLGEVQYRTAKNDMRQDEELERINTPRLIEYKDAYRRDRDLSVLIGIGVYALNIVEAYVNSTFLRYDIKDDVAFRLRPSFQYVPTNSIAGNYASTGLSLTVMLR